PPRAQVHLVDRNRAAPQTGPPAAPDPVLVGPPVVRLEDDGCVLRRHLRAERVRIDLEQETAVLRAALVLVVPARLELGHQTLPGPRPSRASASDAGARPSR